MQVPPDRQGADSHGLTACSQRDPVNPGTQEHWRTSRSGLTALRKTKTKTLGQQHYERPADHRSTRCSRPSCSIIQPHEGVRPFCQKKNSGVRKFRCGASVVNLVDARPFERPRPRSVDNNTDKMRPIVTVAACCVRLFVCWS